MEHQEHGRECNANHQNLVTNQPPYNLVSKVWFSGMLNIFERLENSFIIIGKGPKAKVTNNLDSKILHYSISTGMQFLMFS